VEEPSSSYGNRQWRLGFSGVLSVATLTVLVTLMTSTLVVLPLHRNMGAEHVCPLQVGVTDHCKTDMGTTTSSTASASASAANGAEQGIARSARTAAIGLAAALQGERGSQAGQRSPAEPRRAQKSRGFAEEEDWRGGFKHPQTRMTAKVHIFSTIGVICESISPVLSPTFELPKPLHRGRGRWDGFEAALGQVSCVLQAARPSADHCSCSFSLPGGVVFKNTGRFRGTRDMRMCARQSTREGLWTRCASSRQGSF
jgi:hypothetical protein